VRGDIESPPFQLFIHIFFPRLYHALVLFDCPPNFDGQIFVRFYEILFVRLELFKDSLKIEFIVDLLINCWIGLQFVYF
jgi:hypothetical protein